MLDYLQQGGGGDSQGRFGGTMQCWDREAGQWVGALCRIYQPAVQKCGMTRGKALCPCGWESTWV